MKNFVTDGETVTCTAPYAVLSGGAFKVGAIIAIAVADAANGAIVEGKRRGIFTHAKTSAEAWSAGDKIYFDATNKVFTTASSGNTLCGVAMAAAANPSATGTVLLDGAIR